MGKGDNRRRAQITREQEEQRYKEAGLLGPKPNVMSDEERERLNAEIEDRLRDPYQREAIGQEMRSDT